jgi:hypothetical protein
VALLKDATTKLLEEFKTLKKGGLLERELECIHDHTKGGWTRFTSQSSITRSVPFSLLRYEITGTWHLRDEHGCSLDTPVACGVDIAARQANMQVMAALTEAGLPVIRMGYSALGPHTWLKPHFGMTNGQLKLHLGLRIPKIDGKE